MFEDTQTRWDGINMQAAELKAKIINVKSNKITGPSELLECVSELQQHLTVYSW
jgi:hypothetical protein